MPSIMLGKRSRGTETTGASSKSTSKSLIANDAITTRSKRRIVINEPSDENGNPFISHHEDLLEESVGVQEDSRPVKRTRTTRTVPAKRGTIEQRLEVSPAKINAHFKVAKSSIDVYQDSKNDAKAEPQTPRHRDRTAGRVAVTPRHRTLLAGAQATPRTPKTPSSPLSASTAIYNEARQLFSRSSNPGRLVGRDGERQEMSTFVEGCIASQSAGCLYVSGPPGTGKSALVDEVCQRYKDEMSVKISVVNCMSVRNAKDLAQKLQEDLDLKENSGFEYLRTCFDRGNARDAQKYLIILDEVDALVDMDLELLYSLFEWSMQESSRLILLGIANALDLTDRFLPRLKARNLKPELLPFMPYSAGQIAEVLTSKLRTLAPGSTTVPFLHPAAIQFCSKKVAAQTGDLRKAFDICRRAIDVVEQETRGTDAQAMLEMSPSKTPLMDNINLSSPVTPRSPSKSLAKNRPMVVYTLESAPKATIAHMAKITAQVFGNGMAQRLSTLNLQQKAVLCALAALEKSKRDAQVERTMLSTPSKHNPSAPTVKQLYTSYIGLCDREKLLHPLSSVEFRDVVSGLETLSLVSAVDGRSGSLALPITPSRTPSRKGKGGFGVVGAGDEKRIASAVGVKELEASLEGKGGELLRDLLRGDSLA
ncbi:AAA ATPase [Recurvomyces mirabilis]|uniref:Cell division control protein n=1 Tax=Recurvomyces mirabilis TaxID=574656 RepID=A0AAE1C4M3_9PEZI|nr:AAA ATPase [Recurvomyces mirabilis]KAK5157555.1 AAA ATPase [Recurvomyces mirabilis]